LAIIELGDTKMKKTKLIKKRIISVSLSVLLLICFLSAQLFDVGIGFGVLKVSASTMTWGDYTYTILVDNTIRIDRYNGTDPHVDIPETIDGMAVTVIGSSAFRANSTLISVIIPDSVIEIGNGGGNTGNFFGAFLSCTNLQTVVIGRGVTRISDNMFRFSERLSSITFLGNVTEIGQNAFNGCRGITSLKIPRRTAFR
jgi:hypothetical protein